MEENQKSASNFRPAAIKPTNSNVDKQGPEERGLWGFFVVYRSS